VIAAGPPVDEAPPAQPDLPPLDHYLAIGEARGIS
jgi:hypothetical protein